MKLGKTFLAKIDNLSKQCVNPEAVQEAMRCMMTKTVKKINAVYVQDLFESLLRNKTATKGIHHMARKLCKTINGKRYTQIVEIVMKEKVNDARKCVRREKYEEHEMWKEKRKILNENDVVWQYNDLWAEEKNRQFKMLRNKRKKKVSWLKKTLSKRKDAPAEYKNVIISDQVVTDEFRIEPVCYGGVEINENEKKILSTHPKYSVFDKIDVIDCEAEIEKSLTKIRWLRQSTRKSQNVEENNDTVTTKTVYDIDSKKFDFMNARATDLPFNARTNIPGPLENVEEIPLQNLKMGLLDICKNYTSRHTDGMENLTEEQKDGLKNLKKRQKEGEIVIFQTDKSSKMAIDSPTNYIEAAKAHIEKDKIITSKDHDDIEKKINAHSVFWLTMMQVAKNTNDGARYKTSMMSHNSDYATQYFFRKDHKVFTDQVKGPPTRPLCDVSDSCGHRLSFLISRILKEVYVDEKTVCQSTEDMLASIQKANEDHELGEDAIIGSLDVKALYPSLDIDFAVEVVSTEFYNSEVKIENIDYEELGLYLALNYNKNELDSKSLGKVCPTKKSRRGAPPKITGSGVAIAKKDRFEPWRKAEGIPNEEEKRLMVKEAIKAVLLVIMKNHTYIFNKEIRLQLSGGAIGVDLTGVMAQIFMSWWDKEVLKRMRIMKIDIYLYERYVDDINFCAGAMAPGTRYVNGKLEIVEEEVDADCMIQKDKMTMSLIKQIGDSIHQSIVLEGDVPSNHADGKVPILDLKVWIEDIETENGIKRKIMHEYYSKDVSSKLLIHRDAALSLNVKRTVLTQQCLRIMLNCSPLLSQEKIAEHLSYFMLRMQCSGYDRNLRYEVLKSAFDAYDVIKTREVKDGIPMYRHKEYHRNERRKEKVTKVSSWHGNYETVMFVPATPNSKLQKEMQSYVNSCGAKIKVTEKSGMKIVRLLQKNDPFKRKECGKENCLVCTTEGSGNCRSSGIVYEIECEGECPFTYRGQTSSNAYTRGIKHLEDLVKKRDKPLWKHCVNEHNGEQRPFKMKILTQCRNDPTKRQIIESIWIRNTNPETTMNERSEWNSVRIPRIEINNQ